MQLIFCGFKLQAELELQREQEQKNDFILKGAKQAKRKKGRRCPAQFTKRAGGSKKNVLQKRQAEPALTWCHIPNHKEANRPDRFAGPGGCIGSRIEHSALCYWFAFVTQTCKIVISFSCPSGVTLPWKKIHLETGALCREFQQTTGFCSQPHRAGHHPCIRSIITSKFSSET